MKISEKPFSEKKPGGFKQPLTFNVVTPVFKTRIFVPVLKTLPDSFTVLNNFEKNMKKLLLLPLLALLTMAAYAPTTYSVDVNASTIVWTGYKVTGKHTGTVKVKNGNLTWADGKLTGGSFDIDMTSITDTDLEGEWAAKLVGHLKSEDFFGVEKFPTSKLVITRVLPQDSKGNYKIVANLTIKETTKEVKFFANASEASGKITATGKITVDRSEFNVKYGSGSFFDGLGDKTIYDEFDLQVSLVANK